MELIAKDASREHSRVEVREIGCAGPWAVDNIDARQEERGIYGTYSINYPLLIGAQVMLQLRGEGGRMPSLG